MRRIQEAGMMEEKKEKRKKAVKLIILSMAILWAGYQVIGAFSGKEYVNEPKPENKIAVIETVRGKIKLELFENDAPKTAENFMKLAGEKFYDGIKFHRVEPDFVIQGGDPSTKGIRGANFIYSGDENPNNLPVAGMGGPGYEFEDEINPWSLGISENEITVNEARGYRYDKKLKSHKVDVGSVAMANSGPNTNGSQFFIVTKKAQPYLDGKYTVFGKVLEGMDVVRSIQQGDEMEKVYIEK